MEKSTTETLQSCNHIQQNFYTHNLLKSVKDVQTAIRLLYNIITMCASESFKLTKIIIIKAEVLQPVKGTKRRKGVKNVDLNNSKDLLSERTLAVKWNKENNQLGFTVNLGEKRFTRHGMLSMIFLIKCKTILQDLCKNNYCSDDIVPCNFIRDWKDQLHLLENVVMKICFKPPSFVKIACCSLHYFSDTSQDGYGQVSYI